MTVLSLDTTSRAGSTAVVDDGRVLAEHVGDARLTHGERLPRDLMRVLDAASVPLDAVRLLAVAAGPGSFTGLRVGIAAMQGLATATGLEIVPVSALDALARAAGSPNSPHPLPADPNPARIGAWIDAQRGQVFASLFDGMGREVCAPTSLPPRDTLAAWGTMADGPITFIGDGALRYADVIHRELGARATIVPTAPALAGIIGTIASEEPHRAVLPHAVVPLYIRRPDAELARLARKTEA